MRIRSEQMDALSKHARTDFEARAVEHLTLHFTEYGEEKHREQLEAFVRRAAQQALALNITREIDVLRYLELLVIVGEETMRSPRFTWIRDYLQERRAADIRMDQVFERIRFDADLWS
jgi:hypothetical protein